MSHSLTSFLQLELINVTTDEALSRLPDGWKLKFQNLFIDIGDISPILKRVAISDGVLYIEISDISAKVELLRYAVRSVLQLSAVTCMVCGEYALRRKEQAHKPALCRIHYLDYINNV